MVSLSEMSNNHIVILIVFSLLIIATLTFIIWKKIQPEKNLDELIARTNSWWVIVFIVLLSVIFGKGVTISIIACLSFVALREFLSVVPVDIASRRAILWCYLSIPIQFYAIYINYYPFFISWIPVGMFVILTMRKVALADTKDYTRSLATLYFSLILVVYPLGHFACLRVLKLPGFIGTHLWNNFLFTQGLAPHELKNIVKLAKRK